MKKNTKKAILWLSMIIVVVVFILTFPPIGILPVIYAWIVLPLGLVIGGIAADPTP